MEKSLRVKLNKLNTSPDCDEFILADAKDADMAFGLAATGRCSQTGRPRTLAEYRDVTRQIVEQGLIDICLMSASTTEVLAGEEKLFAASTVTPAVRINDSTDIWLAAGTGDYARQPSLPFRSVSLDRILGTNKVDDDAAVRLGLYSITMNNHADADRETLEAYASFRREAETKEFQHFLEIFPPNAPAKHAPSNANQFICDTVVRTLAGLTRAERPLFLKLPYLGPALTEQLAAYDPSIILGIMGGAAGTTFDSFALLADAKKYGVRAALFGRRINQAEDQLAFVQHLRWIADGQLAAEEGVRSYHADLAKLNLVPKRTLREDLVRTSVELTSS